MKYAQYNVHVFRIVRHIVVVGTDVENPHGTVLGFGDEGTSGIVHLVLTTGRMGECLATDIAGVIELHGACCVADCIAIQRAHYYTSNSEVVVE